MTWEAADTRYDGMQYRRCGRSGLKLPAISLGLWHNFGGDSDRANTSSICRRAFDLGITHFDLANNYGPPPGSAETRFGEILRTDFAGYRDELIVSSKAGYDMWAGPYGEWGSRKYLIASCDQSLRRLGLDYVDVFYSHRFDPDTPLEETMGALDSIVRSGKALYAGVSNYDAAQTARAAGILRELGTPCLINQPSYSMLNRWVERDGLLDVTNDLGIGAITFSPLAQGLLSGRYLHGIDPGSRASQNGFLNANMVNTRSQAALSALADIAKGRGQTLAQMALAWILKDQRVTSVLVGASRAEQVEDCVGAIQNTEFSTEELGDIDRLADEDAFAEWAADAAFT